MISAPVSELFDNRYFLLAQEMLAFAGRTVPLLHTSDAAAALVALDMEFPNIAAVLDVLDSRPEGLLYGQIMDLFLAVGQYLDIRCLWSDSRRWGWALVEQANSPELPADLMDLFTQADDEALPEDTGENGVPPDQLRQERQALAERYNKLGLALWQKNQPEEALRFLRKSLLLQREAGNVPGTAGVLLNMSNVCYATGQFSAGLEHALEAWRIAQAAGHIQLEAHILPHLASSYLSSGLISEADQAYRRAIRLFQILDDEPEAADVMFDYALYCDLCGRQDEALQLARESAAIMEKHGLSGSVMIRGWIEQAEAPR